MKEGGRKEKMSLAVGAGAATQDSPPLTRPALLSRQQCCYQPDNFSQIKTILENLAKCWSLTLLVGSSCPPPDSISNAYSLHQG